MSFSVMRRSCRSRTGAQLFVCLPPSVVARSSTWRALDWRPFGARPKHAAHFFAKKKGGEIRVVLDSRQACLSHRRPPTVPLGSARAMANLDFSDDFLGQRGGFGGAASAPVFAGDADVDDCF